MTDQTKHTKGPWEIGIKDSKGKGIIFGFNRIPVTIYDSGTKEADAFLMAAAPELLEACMWAIVQLDGQVKGYVVGTDMIHGKQAIDKLEQAMAKAEGR